MAPSFRVISSGNVLVFSIGHVLVLKIFSKGLETTKILPLLLNDDALRNRYLH
jgi:hypothetical protein